MFLKNLHLIDMILITAIIVTIIISGYMTFVRLAYGTVHTSYDAWLFGMNLALLLQIMDKHDNSIK
jgi:uncharacterized membrane protein YqhA